MIRKLLILSILFKFRLIKKSYRELVKFLLDKDITNIQNPPTLNPFENRISLKHITYVSNGFKISITRSKLHIDRVDGEDYLKYAQFFSHYINSCNNYVTNIRLDIDTLSDINGEIETSKAQIDTNIKKYVIQINEINRMSKFFDDELDRIDFPFTRYVNHSTGGLSYTIFFKPEDFHNMANDLSIMQSNAEHENISFSMYCHLDPLKSRYIIDNNKFIFEESPSLYITLSRYYGGMSPINLFSSFDFSDFNTSVELYEYKSYVTTDYDISYRGSCMFKDLLKLNYKFMPILEVKAETKRYYR